MKSVLLASALVMPCLHAQEAPEKIREIEQKVLRSQYQEAVRGVAKVAETQGAVAAEDNQGVLGRQLQWLAMVDGQIDAPGKAALEADSGLQAEAGTINDLAWRMVSAQEAGERRPEIALKLVDIALQLGGKDPVMKPRMLDTRARALFLLGKQGEATIEQEKAVAATTNETEKATFQATLASYRKGQLPAVLSDESIAAANAATTALAVKDLRTRMEEIVALQTRIDGAAAKGSEVSGEELTRLKAELESRKADLPKLIASGPAKPVQAKGPIIGAVKIMEKLKKTIIPAVEFENISVEDAAAFLRKKSIELDTSEKDPAFKGLNITVRQSAKGSGAQEYARIQEFRARNIPLAEVLRYICDMAKCRYRVDDYGITFLPANETAEDIFSRTFSVPSDFGSSLVSIEELLKLCGVKFPEGAFAAMTSADTLLVRNTPTEIDKIEQLIETTKSVRARKNLPGRPVRDVPAPSR